MRARGVVLLCATSLIGCADKPELPEGWKGAEEIPVTASECANSSVGASEPTFDLNLSQDKKSVDALYSGAGFRCSQQVCAYHLEKGGVAKVLTQPCDLHPTQVAKCSCVYDLEFSFDAPSSGNVEIWHGTDAYASPAEQRQVYAGPADSLGAE